MADILPIIETMEHRWMRAWVGRDAKELKALTSRDFMLLIGSKPGVILDSGSFLDAATSRFLCSSYRFGDVHARRIGAMALFASQLHLKASIDGTAWSGQFWVTDLWRKSTVRRSWRLFERVLSRTEEDAKVPSAIRSLQLWKS